jgi:hypothetical protein
MLQVATVESHYTQHTWCILKHEALAQRTLKRLLRVADPRCKQRAERYMNHEDRVGKPKCEEKEHNGHSSSTKAHIVRST